MSDETPPPRYFEDHPVGAVFELGTIAVDPEELLAFARRFDPQPMHTDPAAAARGEFGGLIASGWHTGSLMMRLFATRFLSPASSLASPGIDELRWIRPVRPGDTLSVRVTIQEANRSRTRPDRGMLRCLVEVRNQAGEIVMSMRPMNLMRCRPEP
jgi:acyl dehydratase